MGLIMYGVPEEPPELADLFYITLVWHDVEPEPGRYVWDQPILKRALAAADRYNRKIAIRLVTSWQNYARPIPDYLVDQGVRLFPPDPKWQENKWEHFYEPEWWHPKYIEAYERLIRAYGKRFDGDRRIAWIDMRYYGWWNEGHRFGATVPWPESVDRRKLLIRMIDMHRAAFPNTPLVIQTATDRDVPYPEGTAIDYGIEKGAWMRRDGFGPFLNAEEKKLIVSHRMDSVLVAENGGSLRDYLDGKIKKWWLPERPKITIDEMFGQMLDCHVNYLPLGWGWSDYTALKQQRPDLLDKLALRHGYRLIVTEASWPKLVNRANLTGTSTKNNVNLANFRNIESANATKYLQDCPISGNKLAVNGFTITTKWQNTAVGRLPFVRYPICVLTDDNGVEIAKSVAENFDVSRWIEGNTYSVDFRFTPTKSHWKPGKYNVAVGIIDPTSEHADISLGIEGGNNQRLYTIGQLTVL